MKLIKKNFSILTIASIISLFPIVSHANNNAITIDQSFTHEEDGYWKPGRIESKDFYINNNKTNDISIDRLYMNLKYSKCWKTGEELDINSAKFKEIAKYSTVTLKHNKDILFRDKLERILDEDGIELAKEIDIKSNDKELFNMTIDMDLEKGNDAQALHSVFSIGVAYQVEDEERPPIDPDDSNGGNSENDGYKPESGDVDVNGDQSNKLPQTGGIVNSTSLIALGIATIGFGIVLNKKSEEKGGKHYE